MVSRTLLAISAFAAVALANAVPPQDVAINITTGEAVAADDNVIVTEPTAADPVVIVVDDPTVADAAAADPVAINITIDNGDATAADGVVVTNPTTSATTTTTTTAAGTAGDGTVSIDLIDADGVPGFETVRIEILDATTGVTTPGVMNTATGTIILADGRRIAADPAVITRLAATGGRANARIVGNQMVKKDTIFVENVQPPQCGGCGNCRECRRPYVEINNVRNGAIDPTNIVDADAQLEFAFENGIGI
ncbi:Protein of unknown function [Pyronema omphalodes CBS 100304]|uniref:Uncharacterized protein n=1 Tax=Pyronema omphalodes (strain CBS 100304) TaxID=1076935 RepID=U4LXL1_PYROM|nr:Protein of unknown function [Pyronema omphalodes CBS 100304]